MKVLTPHFIAQKCVLLRLDLDVPLQKSNGEMVVAEDSRLRASLPTLYLCLQYASKVIIMGHLGRPSGEDPKLSVAPVVDWLDREVFDFDFPQDKLQVLENLRFEKGEEDCSPKYAKELAKLGDIFVFEAFAAYRPSSSTTLLPKLLPSAAGFHFHHEVEHILNIREHPKRPFVTIIGGKKVEDKYPAVLALSKIADKILVGGRLAGEIREKALDIPKNALIAPLNKKGTDISDEAIKRFSDEVKGAGQIVWNGPMGKYEEGEKKGTLKLAEAVLSSGAETILGGGDSVAALDFYIDKFSFVSTGGGAMLELLSSGTLPTIKALE